MRFWTSIAEYKTDAGPIPAGSEISPLLDRFGARVTRAIFRAVIRRCRFRFARTAICLFATRRLGLLRLSRCADDCRLPPLRFECLAKIIRLDLTKTFDLPRGYGSTTNCRPGRRAAKARGAVPAGQEFVFANLLRRRCSALAKNALREAESFGRTSLSRIRSRK